MGKEGCLRVLHELGGDAAASLVAADADGYTPAHDAAENGKEGCLRVLHELGGKIIIIRRRNTVPFLPPKAVRLVQV